MEQIDGEEDNALPGEVHGMPPDGALEGRSKSLVQIDHSIHARRVSMLEAVLSRENLLTTLKLLEQNKGSYGVDEMPVTSLRGHILLHGTTSEFSIEN